MPRPPATAVQFNLRSALFLLAIISVLCAIFLPFVRHWETDRQIRVLLLLLYFGLLSGAIAALMIRARLKAEAICGARLLKLPIGHKPRRTTAWAAVAGMGISLIVIAFCHELLHDQRSTRPPSGILLDLFIFLPIVMNFTMFGLQSWWKTVNALELCENGLIVANYAYPWSQVRSIRFDKETGHLHLAVGKTSYAWQAVVLEEDRETLSQLLQEQQPTAVS